MFRAKILGLFVIAVAYLVNDSPLAENQMFDYSYMCLSTHIAQVAMAIKILKKY